MVHYTIEGVLGVVENKIYMWKILLILKLKTK